MYKISYTGDGATTDFLFAFPFFQNADIHVSVNGAALDDTQYGVWPNEDFTGGTVILQTPPATGDTVDVFRRISLSRVVDYQPTAKIDPEHLNDDFNFLLAAFQDLQSVDIDLAQWANVHDTVMQFLRYNLQVVEDKLSGGGVMGLYNNLVSVLANALPTLINDYGSVTEPAPNENADDYGIL